MIAYILSLMMLLAPSYSSPTSLVLQARSLTTNNTIATHEHAALLVTIGYHEVGLENINHGWSSKLNTRIELARAQCGDNIRLVLNHINTNSCQHNNQVTERELRTLRELVLNGAPTGIVTEQLYSPYTINVNRGASSRQLYPN